MPFTDDDMKKLEEGYWFKRVPIANVGQSESWVWCDGDKIIELLCRLKAAEKILNCSNEGCVIDKNHWVAWRRESGK